MGHVGHLKLQYIHVYMFKLNITWLTCGLLYMRYWVFYTDYPRVRCKKGS